MLKKPESCRDPNRLLETCLGMCRKYGLGVGVFFLFIHFETHLHVTVLNIRKAKFVKSRARWNFLEMMEGFELFTLQKLHGLETVYTVTPSDKAIWWYLC